MSRHSFTSPSVRRARRASQARRAAAVSAFGDFATLGALALAALSILSAVALGLALVLPVMADTAAALRAAGDVLGGGQ